jgi:hypothetical protein
VYLSTTVNTQSNGAAPSGSVSFQVNGAPLAATVQYTPAAGSPTSNAYLGAATSYLPTVSGSYTLALPIAEMVTTHPLPSQLGRPSSSNIRLLAFICSPRPIPRLRDPPLR